MASYLHVNAVAPQAYTLRLTPETASGVDLSTVTAATLYARRADGTIVTWTATLSNQTTTTLTLTHLFAVGEVPSPGNYVVYAELTRPDGVLESERVVLPVKGRFEV